MNRSWAQEKKTHPVVKHTHTQLRLYSYILRYFSVIYTHKLWGVSQHTCSPDLAWWGSCWCSTSSGLSLFCLWRMRSCCVWATQSPRCHCSWATVGGRRPTVGRPLGTASWRAEKPRGCTSLWRNTEETYVNLWASNIKLIKVTWFSGTQVGWYGYIMTVSTISEAFYLSQNRISEVFKSLNILYLHILYIWCLI